MRHLKGAHELRPIRRQLDDLWQSSVAVATIGRIVAQRAKLNPDEAFLTGLLSIIGKLYILVRAVSQAEEFACDPEFSLTIRSWHAGIGKAVVENWGFSSEIADAVGEQENNDRSINTDMVSLHDVNCKADLVDVMFVSLLLARALEFGDSAAVTGKESRAFSRLGLTEADCKTVILQAKQHTEVVQSSLGG